jgi:hypothetical protein
MNQITSFTSGIILTLGVILTLFASMWTKFTDMTVTSPIIFSIFLMILGLLFMRGWIREAKTLKQQEMLKITHIANGLKEFRQTIEKWQLSANKATLILEINEVSEKYLLPLNHQHQTIKAIYGQQSLDIILNLAQIERLLNRMQSAALDGYPHEVQNSYDELILVVQLLKHSDNVG